MTEELQHGERADEIEQSVGQPEVEELRTPGEEADDRKQHDASCADRIACEHAIEDGRPLIARVIARASATRMAAAAAANITRPLEPADAAIHPAPSRSRAPSLRAHGQQFVPFTPTVIVPGVSVIEFA